MGPADEPCDPYMPKDDYVVDALTGLLKSSMAAPSTTYPTVPAPGTSPTPTGGATVTTPGGPCAAPDSPTVFVVLFPPWRRRVSCFLWGTQVLFHHLRGVFQEVPRAMGNLYMRGLPTS